MGQEKSVLVTGATGFIGRATVSSLEQAGWRVTKAHRSTDPAITEDVIAQDLAKPDAILALANDVRFDAIVHLGAHINWSGATDSEMYVPNVLSTGCLALLASRWNAHLIFCSAAIVCGVRTQKIDARSPNAPDTAYAHSKWLGEQLIVASQCTHCILRVAGVFGADGPMHLGLNRAIDDAIKGTPPTQIGAGRALRNYIYVKDVAETIAFVLKSKLEGIHLLAGSEAMHVSQMLREICEIFCPDQLPALQDGHEAISQVIQPSRDLPMTRKFREALADIKGVGQ
jgi:nucleoside-diphosphate-sugar epimerase